MLRTVTAVIVDEVHAVAATKRGAHLALSLERLAVTAATEPQRVALSATQRPLDEVARFVGGDRPVTIVDAGVRKELDLEVPCRSRTWPTAARRREPPGRSRTSGRNRRRRALDLARHLPRAARARAARTARRWSSSTAAGSPSGSRCGSNELAGRAGRPRPPRLALARGPQRDRGGAEGRRAAVPGGHLSLELGIDMGAIDLVCQVESPGSVARGLQRIGRAGHQVGEPSRAASSRSSAATCSSAPSSRGGMHAGAIEETRVPQNPLDVLAQQIVAMCRDRASWQVDDLTRWCARAYPYRELPRGQLDGVLDMLVGPLPVGRVRRAAPADRLGPRRGQLARPREGAIRWRSPTPARFPTAASSACSCVDGSGRGRRARRGDGLRGARGPGVPARRVSRGGSRRSPATACSSRPRPASRADPVLEGRRARPPGRAGPAIGAFVRESRRADGRRRRDAARRRARPRRAARPRNLVAYLRDQRDATGACCRPTARSSSSGSATRSATGGSASCRRSAAACTRRGRSRSARCCASGSGAEAQALWSDDGIILHLPDADEPPPAELVALDPDDDRGPGRARARRLRAVRRAVPRERGARAADPAPPARASARRSGSSG